MRILRMLRRCLSVGVVAEAVFILAVPLCADEYELQYRVLDLRQEGIRMERVFRPK